MSPKQEQRRVLSRHVALPWAQRDTEGHRCPTHHGLPSHQLLLPEIQTQALNKEMLMAPGLG